MSDASGQTAWSYDKMGRVVTEERTIGSVTKTLSYSYNLDGSPATVTYPSGRTVTYAPSAVGRAISAKDVPNSVNYVTSATYAPQAALATANYGSSITFSVTYDTHRLWPTDLKGATSSTFFELKPSFNYNKTVSGVTNALTSGRTASYTYDNLNRLITAQSTATSGTYCWGQAVPPYGSDNANGYDRYGNLVKIDSIQCSSPALNLSVNGYNQFTAYTYDAAGNMLTDGSTNSYTWNGEGLLKSTGTVNYTYDGNRNRVEKSSGTYYWLDRYGLVLAETDTSGNTQNEYIYFGRNRTAWRDSGGNVYYYFRDQIGTTRMIANSSGTVCYDADYAPFGYEMAHTTNCSQNYKLAGMELDGETGNYHTLFRQYEPNLARWMSPDPKRGCIKDPQKLDLYSYVRNGPTYRTDRRGDIDEGPCDPFTNPSCNNILTGSGWCEPWNLLCQWGTPQPAPFSIGCGTVISPTFSFGEVVYDQITDASVGGGDCGAGGQAPVPPPPGTVTCLGELISGSSRAGGCTYGLSCADGHIRVAEFQCNANTPYAFEKCPQDVIADCPEGLFIRCTVGNFCGPGIPNSN